MNKIKHFLCTADPIGLGFAILLIIGLTWAACFDLQFFIVLICAIAGTAVVIATMFGLAYLIKKLQSKCKENEDV